MSFIPKQRVVESLFDYTGSKITKEGMFCEAVKEVLGEKAEVINAWLGMTSANS